MTDIIMACSVVSEYIPNILLTLGKDGVLFCGRQSQSCLTLTESSKNIDPVWVSETLV